MRNGEMEKWNKLKLIHFVFMGPKDGLWNHLLAKHWSLSTATKPWVLANT